MPKSITYHSPFENHINKSTNNIVSVQDSSKGFYMPELSAVVMNVDYKEVMDEYMNLGEFFSQYDPQNNPMWFSSLFHEMSHYYTISGTSLGGIHALAWWAQKHQIENFIEDMAVESPDAIKQFIAQKKTYIKRYGSIKDWRLWQNIKCLFTGGYDEYLDFGYMRKVSDFSASLYHAIAIFSIINEKQSNSNTVGFDDLNKLLFLDMAQCGDVYIDYLFSVEDFGGSFDKAIHDFSDEESLISDLLLSYYVPSSAIIEGYARWCEWFNFIYAMRKKDPSKYMLTDSKKEKFNSYQKHKWEGVYGLTTSIMSFHFIDLAKENMEDFRDTISAIYELSLMTRLHPALLPLNKKPRLNEIIISQRFRILLSYFFTKKESLYNLCGKDGDFVSGLDKVCSDLGWIKYSESLEALRSFYSHESWRDFYPFVVNRMIIENKLKGNLFIYKGEDFNNIPSYIIFNDTILLPDISYYPDLNIGEQDRGFSFLKGITQNIFSQELFCMDGFDYTKKFLRRCYFINKNDKDFLSELINQKGLSLFLDVNDII